MSLTDPEPNALYILLFIRSDLPLQNDFHWSLYHHTSPSSGGKKYHVIGRSSRWLADHSLASDITKSFLLVGLFQIAFIPAEFDVDSVMRSFDDRLNDVEGLNCRTWVFDVLGSLRGSGVLRCDDLGALEREALDWGNVYAVEACGNIQPRPLGRSALCGL